MTDDPYSVLGVAPTATDQEIKQAFRRLARACHPDVAGTDPDAAQRFKDVRAAYELLSDPVTRARHDRRRDRASGPTSDFETFWRASMRSAGGAPQSAARPRGRSSLRDPANHVSLDDLMNFEHIRVDREPPRPPPPPRPEPPKPAPPTEPSGTVDVPLVTALKGGSVTAHTPRGDVRLTIPAGCQGGTRLRLANKGTAGDWVVTTRIVLPAELDEQGRRLLDALAAHLEH